MKSFMTSIHRYWVGLLISNILLWWSVLPLLGNGYFPMHDDTQIARIISMGNALRESQFPVRLVDGLGYGYGYPIFNFYSPLPYYVGGALYAIGVDAITSTKIMFLLPIFLGASFLFMFLQPVYGITASIVGSLLFSYAPYHAVQIFIRGSVGEYWAISFVPLLLLSIYNTKKYKGYLWVVLGSFSVALILTSHTILASLVLSLYVLGIMTVFVYQIVTGILKNFSFYTMLLLMLLGGLGLSAFFWLPAYLEMKYTGVSSMINMASTDFYDHFVCVSQLWNSPWGFGGSAPGCMSDGMSFKLGKVHVLLGILSLLFFIRNRILRSKESVSFQFSIGLGILFVSIFGMLEYSAPVWKLFPFTSLVQYPWRLLSIAMLAIGIVGAYLVTQISLPKPRIFAAVMIIAGTLAINAKLFIPKYLYIPDLKKVFSDSDIRFRISKISDEYLPDTLKKPTSANDVPSRVLTSKSDSRITITAQKSTYVAAHIENSVDDVLTFQKAAFPGWKFTINGTQVESDIIQGLFVFRLPKGKHQFEAVFKDTPIRSQSTIISVMTLLLLGGLLFYGQKTKA